MTNTKKLILTPVIGIVYLLLCVLRGDSVVEELHKGYTFLLATLIQGTAIAIILILLLI